MNAHDELDRIRKALGIRERTCVWGRNRQWVCGLFDDDEYLEMCLEWDSVEEAVQVTLDCPGGPHKLTWVYPWEHPSDEVMCERVRDVLKTAEYWAAGD